MTTANATPTNRKPRTIACWTCGRRGFENATCESGEGPQPHKVTQRAPVRQSREYRRARAMDRWAERYDELNGAPESDDDR